MTTQSVKGSPSLSRETQKAFCWQLAPPANAHEYSILDCHEVCSPPKGSVLSPYLGLLAGCDGGGGAGGPVRGGAFLLGRGWLPLGGARGDVPVVGARGVPHPHPTGRQVCVRLKLAAVPVRF